MLDPFANRRGRPNIEPSIDEVQPITPGEASTPKARAPSVKTLRDSHHRVARLFAMGLRSGEVAELSGYGLARVSVLHNDPAFQELIAHYRDMVNQGFIESADEYYSLATSNRVAAARLINDKLLGGEPEDFSLSQLVSVHADAADRTGYGKRSTTVNVNLDFAAKLDAARKRSSEAKTIDHSPPAHLVGDGGEGQGLAVEAPAPQLIRRA